MASEIASAHRQRHEQGHASSQTVSGRLMLRVWWALVLVTLAAVASTSYLALRMEAIPVRVAVDGRIEVVYSQRPDVAALLQDLGLAVRPEDVLSPGRGTALVPGLSISLERSRPYLVRADGAARTVFSRGRTVGDLLLEAGVPVHAKDEIWMEGFLVEPAASLLASPVGRSSKAYALPRAWLGNTHLPVVLEVRRAVALTVDDGSVPFTIHTTAPTVGEALLREGILLHLGDTVWPSLGSGTRAGMRVAIERSKSLLITADGRTFRTRTERDTVGDSLVDLGIVVAGSDRVTPALDQLVVDNMEIQVVRVLETVAVERKAIPFEAMMSPDDALEIDQQRIAQTGANGELRRRFAVVTEDNVETSRRLTDEWIASEPEPKIVSYGRKIVSRPLETEEGTLSYWRKIEMYATAYSPARSGTPRSAPWYGRTRIGLQLRKGLVAVDPKVIPLGTRVYVPGYGVALAADTGGGVRGRMIDLGYEDGNYQSWHWWVDVYVLDPPTAPAKTAWVLPKYPEGRFPYRRK